MTLIDRLSKLDGPDREAELLRLYQDEKQRADSMSDDWVNFCNYIGIDLDTQEAVAEAINAARHKDQVEHQKIREALEYFLKAYRDDFDLFGAAQKAQKALDGGIAILRAKEASNGQ